MSSITSIGGAVGQNLLALPQAAAELHRVLISDELDDQERFALVGHGLSTTLGALVPVQRVINATTDTLAQNSQGINDNDDEYRQSEQTARNLERQLRDENEQKGIRINEYVTGQLALVQTLRDLHTTEFARNDDATINNLTMALEKLNLTVTYIRELEPSPILPNLHPPLDGTIMRIDYENDKYYEGEVLGEERTGYGILVSSQSGRCYYSGLWNNDKRHGWGWGYTCRFLASFTGIWEDDTPRKGTMLDPNGRTYAGHFKDERLEGFGWYITSIGYVYIGQFENGRGIAPGICIPSETWQELLKDPQIASWAKAPPIDGGLELVTSHTLVKEMLTCYRIYQGDGYSVVEPNAFDMKEAPRETITIEHDSLGLMCYKGDTVDSKRDGWGVLKIGLEGATTDYTGTWFNDKRHGFGCGTFTLPFGKSGFFFGVWDQDTPRRGTFTWDRIGETYVGDFDYTGNLEGSGCHISLTYTYIGQMKKGKYSGYGMYIPSQSWEMLLKDTEICSWAENPEADGSLEYLREHPGITSMVKEGLIYQAFDWNRGTSTGLQKFKTLYENRLVKESAYEEKAQETKLRHKDLEDWLSPRPTSFWDIIRAIGTLGIYNLCKTVETNTLRREEEKRNILKREFVKLSTQLLEINCDNAETIIKKYLEMRRNRQLPFLG